MGPRISFDHELKELNASLAEMGRYVEQSIDSIFLAFETQDRELAKAIMEGDRTVDDMEKSIESKCLSLITRQNPVARDLRMISAALKVITDIERIGDHAADIAELILRFDHVDLYHLSSPIPAMVEEAKKMVHDSVEAFIRMDVVAAEEVVKRDDIVDELFNQVKEELVISLREEKVDPDYGVDILMIAKYLERIGDHAVNICEWTEFQKSGLLDNVRLL